MLNRLFGPHSSSIYHKITDLFQSISFDVWMRWRPFFMTRWFRMFFFRSLSSKKIRFRQTFCFLLPSCCIVRSVNESQWLSSYNPLSKRYMYSLCTLSGFEYSKRAVQQTMAKKFTKHHVISPFHIEVWALYHCKKTQSFVFSISSKYSLCELCAL